MHHPYLSKRKKNIKELFDPKVKIEDGYKDEPYNKTLFKSYNIQVATFGNEDHRRTLINGINSLTSNTKN